MTRAAMECSGAPRDIGHAQGQACRDILREAFARLSPPERLWRWLGRTEGAASDLARDLRRHFPHQAECLEGLARGAGVPFAHLLDTLAASLVPGVQGPVAFARTAGAVRVAYTPPPGALLRRVSPEAGFRALEVTLPGLPAALAGINEKGLAGVVAHIPGDTVSSRCAAPAALLLTDCLLRFEALEGALDWCLGRPAGGAAVVLLADARGEVAGVEFEGSERRVLRPADGFLLEAGRGARQDDLAKSLREATSFDARALAGAVAPGSTLFAVDPESARAAVIADDTETWQAV